MHLSRVSRCVTTDIIALVGVSIIGLVGSAVYHVPLALSFIQLLAIELLSQAYPLATLIHDKQSHKVRDTQQRQVIFELITFGLLAAALAYANYLGLFARHNLSPAYIDTSHPLHREATTLALLTLALCQATNLLFVRIDAYKRLTLKRLLNNQKLIRAFAVSAFLVLNVIYNPWLHGLFGTRALSFLDWVMAGVATGLYIGARLIQRHSREHTRHAVVKLHHEVHKSKA